jgi:hypothetical protein
MAMIWCMGIDRQSKERAKDLDNWEQEAAKQYSRIITTAQHVLEAKRHIQVVYAEIEESLSRIQIALKEDPKQGEQVIKVKKNFLSQANTSTFSGHMNELGGRLERKFVTDTEKLCSETANTCIEFDHRMLGEFLERHGVKARKLDHTARAAQFDEIIKQDPLNRPIFYNIRRNLLAIVEELSKKD